MTAGTNQFPTWQATKQGPPTAFSLAGAPVPHDTGLLHPPPPNPIRAIHKSSEEPEPSRVAVKEHVTESNHAAQQVNNEATGETWQIHWLR